MTFFTRFMFAGVALFSAAAAPAFADQIGEVGVDWLGNDIVIEAIKDPKVTGVTCHVAYFDRGVIDRLHIFRDQSGAIVRVEIIDFKTDRTDDAAILREAHLGQLGVYRILIARALAIDASIIRCLLLGTHAGLIVEC